MLADLHDSVFFYCVHEEQGGEEFEISFGGMFDHHTSSTGTRANNACYAIDAKN